MPRKKKIGVGVFEYDGFPYMVTHSVYGYGKDGDIDIGSGFWMKPSVLIVVLPVKQGNRIAKTISAMKVQVNKRIQNLKDEALLAFFQHHPTLKRK